MTDESLNDDELEKRMRAALDERSDAYDAATLSQLNQARQRALDELERRRSPGFGALPLAGATAAAVVVAVVLASRLDLTADAGGPGMTELAAVDDFELLMAGDELDMIENVEFYAVLEAL